MKPSTDTDFNDALMARARQVIPGGVNSPVRAFRAVGGTPRFVQRAHGAYFWDANDQRYIDYIGSWGPMILGHGHPAVLEAVQQAATEGLSFGAPTEREIELAEEILSLVPSMEMLRLVSSGTEAGMTAIRLARGATGRSKILKFEGCYHGHADALLVKAGSGLATFGNPTSAGVPPEVVQHTLVLEYNNVAQLEEAFALHGPEIAGLIIEPIAGNMNFVRATVEFTRRCRELCTQHGALLIYDEVMSGAGRSGKFLAADHWPQARPDLVILAKGIAAGYTPMGCVLVSAEMVNSVAEAGGFMHGFTYFANPLSCAIGHAVLTELVEHDLMNNAAARGAELKARLQAIAAESAIVGDVRGLGLLLAVELVADKESKRQLPLELVAPSRFQTIALEQGLAVYSRRTAGGRFGDWFMVSPPLTVSSEQVEEIAQGLAKALRSYEEELAGQGVLG